MDTVLSMALGKAQQLYSDVESNELQMIKLKVTLNGIMEGLESYRNLSIEGESKCIDSVLISIDGAVDKLAEVRGRGFIWKYIKGSKDKEAIKEATEMLAKSLESLLTKIQLANAGAVRG